MTKLYAILLLSLLLVLAHCSDGSHFIEGPAGPQGERGLPGIDGVDGKDGLDGKDGQDGQDGLNALVEIIDPCGTETNYDEVLFRFSDGNLYAVYSDGKKKIHLVKLVPGTYKTTDGTNCIFTITPELEVTW